MYMNPVEVFDAVPIDILPVFVMADDTMFAKLPVPELIDVLPVLVVAVNPANVEAPIAFKGVASVVAPVV